MSDGQQGKKGAGASFRQDMLDAWNDYQATGLHATQEEADQWLSRLEAGEDAAPPKPHHALSPMLPLARVSPSVKNR